MIKITLSLIDILIIIGTLCLLFSIRLMRK